MVRNVIERIVFVTPWYGEFAGGAEVAARSIAEVLVQCGVEVEVLTTCCKSPYDDWWIDSLKPGSYQNNGVTIRRFSVNRFGKELYQQSVVKHASGKELDIDEKNNFFTFGINSDLLIEFAQNVESETPIVALPYFQSLTHSLVTRLPGRVILMPCFHDEPQFYWEPVRNMLINAKDIIYLSEEEKDLTIKNYGINIGRKVVEAIVTGIGVESVYSSIFSPKGNCANDQAVLAKYKLPEQFFIYVGRKEAGKGVVELINWYKKYLDYRKESNKKSVPIVFVGGGDVSLIPVEETFIDLGFINESDKYSLLRSALALINLSQNESFSLVIMEAWLCGTPAVVSSRCKVTAGHCRRSNGGLAVGDVEEFCAALNAIIEWPDMRLRVGKQGFNYVKENYDWSEVLGRLSFALNQSNGGFQ